MKLLRVVLAIVFISGLVVAGALQVYLTRDQRGTIEMPTDDPGCRGDAAAELQQRPPTEGFTDATEVVRLGFQHVVGPLGTYFMPESIGAGGALFDFDRDGRLDIYLVNCGRSPDAVGEFPPETRIENRLFHQTEDGTFEDVTSTSGLGDQEYGAGCAVADVNNDGYPDVYITNYGPDRLYLNDRNGTFSNVTEVSEIANPDWGTGAAFLDYNRDGLLDLVVVNYTADPVYGHSIACGFNFGLISYCGPRKFEPTVDRLFRNDGFITDDAGRTVPRFTDVTEESGFGAAMTCGFGVVCADLTGDGWVDVYIASDAMPNRLWVNQHDGRFVDEGLLRGVALNGEGHPQAGMGAATGDVNRDGRPDLVVTNLSLESSTLYRSQQGNAFEDATDDVGLRAPTRIHTGWGVVLTDLNHDGQLDLPIVNGLVVPCHSRFPFHGKDTFVARRDVIDNPNEYWRDYADGNVLLLGTTKGGFRDATLEAGDFCTGIDSGRALISGDIDNDGDIDLLATNCGGRARLYRNDFAKDGDWLLVYASDPRLHREANGAEIIVRAKGKEFHGIVSPSSGYLASNDSRVHFGLGHVDHYDEIVVRWPDGPVNTASEVFPGGPVGRLIEVRRGEGRPLVESHP